MAEYINKQEALKLLAGGWRLEHSSGKDDRVILRDPNASYYWRVRINLFESLRLAGLIARIKRSQPDEIWVLSANMVTYEIPLTFQVVISVRTDTVAAALEARDEMIKKIEVDIRGVATLTAKVASVQTLVGEQEL